MMHLERLIYEDYYDCAYYYRRHMRKKNRPQRVSKSTRLRKVIFVRDNFTCQQCKKVFKKPEKWNGAHIPGLTLGHVIPRSHGGGRTLKNLRAQCEPCNTKLGNLVWVEELNKY